MTLIKCSECGKEYSDKAESCPNCATPTKIVKNKNENKKVIENIVISLICISIVLITCLFITNKNTKYIVVPDVSKNTEEEAVETLKSNSLRPTTIESYSQNIEEGSVIVTSPKAGDKVKENEIITVYVSKGPSYIESTDSTVTWYSISSIKEDDWEFTSPYIQEEYLYIECQPKFGVEFDWPDNDYGYASTNATFTKKIPIELNYVIKHVKVNEKQNIIIKIPTEELKTKKPTLVFLKLNIMNNNKKETISLNFTISWDENAKK